MPTKRYRDEIRWTNQCANSVTRIGTQRVQLKNP